MGVTFRTAGPADAAALNAALRRLSDDLDDAHGATDAALAAAISGPAPTARGVLGWAGEQVVAAALYSPTFSTVRGAGAYVSDLWVDPARRGAGLGKRLLGALLRDAEITWGATRLTLNVYHTSAASRRFYDRLGFVAAQSYTTMTLESAACQKLKGAT